MRNDIELEPGDWRPRTPESPYGQLRMQVVRVERSQATVHPDWVWVEGWRYVDGEPTREWVRELARYAALPPDLRPLDQPEVAGGQS